MPTSPYQRVAAEIRRRIAVGDWPPGHQLPSQAALAIDLGVSIAEARRGMAVLRQAGELEGTPRTRLRVAHPPAVRTLLDPDAPWPYAKGDGAIGTCRASSDLADRLDVRRGTLLSWELVECLDPDLRPSHLVTTWWAGARPTSWDRSVAEARLHQLTAHEAERLGLAAGLYAWCIMRTRLRPDGTPAEVADLVLPADRWRVRLA
ncbi:GntR family transcriptional regulator [Kitasatospora griseola]|uniref:GntR family transcriptional regulator n=1 Tax=Kitasatospora griseola TaxID=2064 RepID=UPI003665B5BB